MAGIPHCQNFIDALVTYGLPVHRVVPENCAAHDAQKFFQPVDVVLVEPHAEETSGGFLAI